MSNRLFVGNLDYQLSDRELRDAFMAVGGVERAEVARDKLSGTSKGFGFVTMMTAEEAERAVEKLNGEPLRGRKLRIEIAKSEPRNGNGRDNRRDNGRDRHRFSDRD